MENMEQSMQKTIKGAVGVLTLLIMIIAVFMVIRIFKEVNVVDANQNNTITVDGDAEVFSVPNIATISFSVRAENLDLVKAQEEAETKVSTAVEAIKALGVEEKDIQTTYYNANPRYEWDNKCGQYGCETGDRKLVGYEVSETITIKVRDLAKASPAIGALGTSKVTDIQGPSFGIEDRDALMQEARKEAIKEAKEKAKVLADELGVKLGRIVSYYDGGNGYPVPMSAKAETDMAVSNEARGGAAPTIVAGENRIYSSVTIVYKIK
jgi:uncharacterized protein YggE